MRRGNLYDSHVNFPRWTLTACAVFTSGCGRYSDFTLPPLPQTASIHLKLDVQPNPVLTRGAKGEWDSVDALNPSIVFREGTYYNFYSGFDGNTWRTGLATSSNGADWTKRGRVLSPDAATWEAGYIAANGAALASGGEFLYWYQAGSKNTPAIGLARSRDGVQWHKDAQPVLGPGPRGSWDERGVGDPYVVRIGEWIYMYHLGQDRAHRQRLGLARSRDGVRWDKLRSNPVMDPPWPGSDEMDENGQGEPAVWQSHGWYWMLFTGRDRREHRALALARSQDGVHWEREPATFAGTEAWNRATLCDPTVLVHDATINVWFGGGSKASPDENVDGQIGVGMMHP